MPARRRGDVRVRPRVRCTPHRSEYRRAGRRKARSWARAAESQPCQSQERREGATQGALGRRGAARVETDRAGDVRAGSEARQGALARVGYLEEGVELRQLEEGSKIVVQVGEPELPALFANLLGERDQHAEPTRRTPISYAVFCLKKKKEVT